MRAYGSKSTKDHRADTIATVKGSLRAVHTGMNETIRLSNELSGKYDGNESARSRSSSMRSRGSKDALDAPLFARPASKGGTESGTSHQATHLASQTDASMLVMG
jgi:hypothetical protein